VAVVASTLSTPIDAIERWPPEKTLSYYEHAIEIRKLFSGQMH